MCTYFRIVRCCSITLTQSKIHLNCLITDALDSKFSDESDDFLADEGISAPERAYRGPHLVFPLQKKDIDTLIELFRKKKVYRT